MADLKIALVGSAPSSCRIAPYQDPSWKIWGCSPGLYGIAPRVDEWFELHLWEPGQTWFSPEYVQWLKALPGRGVKLWTGGEVLDLPGSEVFPFDAVQAEFDPHDWYGSSTLYWMMARAMREGATKIGFWGVDMAAGEEYEMQRAGLHHLSYIAKAKGIEVGIPMESDLFTPRFRYGQHEWSHGFRKWRARKHELEVRKAEAEKVARAKQDEAFFLAGAIDDVDYMHATWMDRQSRLGPDAVPLIMRGIEVAPAPVHVPQPVPQPPVQEPVKRKRGRPRKVR